MGFIFCLKHCNSLFYEGNSKYFTKFKTTGNKHQELLYQSLFNGYKYNDMQNRLFGLGGWKRRFFLHYATMKSEVLQQASYHKFVMMCEWCHGWNHLQVKFTIAVLQILQKMQVLMCRARILGSWIVIILRYKGI